MNPKERLRRLDTLLNAGRAQQALPPYERLYDVMVRDILARALEYGYPLEIPGEDYLDLYLGHSEHLGAYKIGIGKDALNRAKSIKSVNATQGNGDDFRLVRVVRGPNRLVRAAEKRIKVRFAHLVIMGREWFSDVESDFLTVCTEEQRQLVEDRQAYLLNHSPMDDLSRTRSLLEIFGPMDAASRVVHLGARVKAWDNAFAEMTECCKQQVHA